jgi:putative ABC transport system ATP-binding protein
VSGLLLDVSALAFAYPGTTFRLQVPALGVSAGEKVAVVGPSGSGKTTLLELIAGIRLPGAGRVVLDGIEMSALADGARRALRISRIGFVFQDFGLLEYLSVQDNIVHPYRISRALRLDGTVHERAAWLAERAGLGEKLRRRPGHLSQGERQRVALCRAIVTTPRLVLADEATGNLDAASKWQALDLLFDAVDAHDSALVAVTHDHELLPRFDRVVDFGRSRQAR